MLGYSVPSIYCDTSYLVSHSLMERNRLAHNQAIFDSITCGKTCLVMSDLAQLEFLDAIRKTVSRTAKKDSSLKDIDSRIRSIEMQFFDTISSLAEQKKMINPLHPDTVNGYHYWALLRQKSFAPETIRRGTMLKSGVPESRDIEHMYQAIHAGATVLYTWDQGFAKLAKIAKLYGLHIHVLHEDEPITWPWDLARQNGS